MIKSTDLRIGNIINNNGDIAYVTEISDEYVTITCPNPPYRKEPHNDFLEYCFPISITEEWLLKLGFVIRSTTECWANYSTSNRGFMISRCKQDSPEVGTTAGKFYWSETLKEIKYIHRLQNLVYELTDKELVIVN